MDIKTNHTGAHLASIRRTGDKSSNPDLADLYAENIRAGKTPLQILMAGGPKTLRHPADNTKH